MVLVELVKFLLSWLVGAVGLNGLAVGGLALVLVGLWYLHELSGVFVVLARWSRMAFVAGVVVFIAFVAAVQLGLVDLTADGSVIGSLLSVIEGFL